VSGESVLVIDDEEPVRRFLRVALDGQSYQVIEAATGKDGIRAVELQKPDVIILDLGLPDLDGVEVTRLLRQTTQTPVIILSEIVTIVTHRGILSTSLVEAVQYFAYGAIETYLPRYLTERTNFTTLAIGSLFTGQIVVVALTKPLMGRLSDRHGRILIIVSGLILGGVCTAALSFTLNWFVLIALIGLFGLGLATVTASTSALVADISKSSSRGSALGLLSTIMDIGQSLGPILTGVMLGIFVGNAQYKIAFGIIGGLMMVASLLYAVVMRGVSTAQVEQGGV